METILVTEGCPSVSVPVLSKTIVSILCPISRDSADFINIPCEAALPVPTIMATGVAKPKAHGQEMTNTAIPMDNANSKGKPNNNQTAVDKIDMVMTMGTNMPLILSAKREIGALEAEASSTNRMICDRVVSSPTLVARKVI